MWFIGMILYNDDVLVQILKKKKMTKLFFLEIRRVILKYFNRPIHIPMIYLNTTSNFFPISRLSKQSTCLNVKPRSIMLRATTLMQHCSTSLRQSTKRWMVIAAMQIPSLSYYNKHQDFFINIAYQGDSTLLDGKDEQNPTILVTQLIANTGNTTMYHGDPYYECLQ